MEWLYKFCVAFTIITPLSLLWTVLFHGVAPWWLNVGTGLLALWGMTHLLPFTK